MKSKEINSFLDTLAGAAFGETRTHAISQGFCLTCGVEFRDDLSKREFQLSGMCQNCQDDFFGIEEE
jgi:uncharacterized CHY-type Zn-finger protein